MSAPSIDRGQRENDTHRVFAPVDPVGQGQAGSDDHIHPALTIAPDQTRTVSMPSRVTSDPATTQQDHGPGDAHAAGVLLAPVEQGHAPGGNQGTPALVDISQATGTPDPNLPAPGMEAQPGEAIIGSASIEHTPRPADALLLIFADALDDLEQVRIATENRVRSLAQVKGLDDTPESQRFQTIVDGLAALEHEAELQLKRELRKHPLGPWVKATIGIGEKQGARLLAAIGDPAWNHAEDRPRRGPAELWAYCGLHVLNPGQRVDDTQTTSAGEPSGQSSADSQISRAAGRNYPGHGSLDAHTANVGDPSGQLIHDAHSGVAAGNGHPGDQSPCDAHCGSVSGVAPKRARGQKANWNATAKMRTFLIAESCIKQATSPYRAVYDEGRAKYANALHAYPCVRCGPKDKPAQPGSPLSAGHQHARALRLVMKAILRDLWVEARRATS